MDYSLTEHPNRIHICLQLLKYSPCWSARLSYLGCSGRRNPAYYEEKRRIIGIATGIVAAGCDSIARPSMAAGG